MRQAIAEGAKEGAIRLLARQKGYGDLLSSGVKKVLQGLTTPEEILRATFAEDIT
jgi:type II secretory ATPase GspE/PulE/Tfp pilus assembly ATPase PilB-like protein